MQVNAGINNSSVTVLLQRRRRQKIFKEVKTAFLLLSSLVLYILSISEDQKNLECRA